MLKYLICLITLISFLPSTHAQDWEGLLLIRVVEVGTIDAPNHLFLADAGESRVTELLVENERFFSPWFGWSPDGSKFAYLAPARRGIHYELWLADANLNAPIPRAVLFNLDLTALVARWNPVFNIVAVGTESQSTSQDGLYLVNANFENVVFLEVLDLPRDGILDWSHSGEWLAYSTENAALEMINTETRSVVSLQNFTQPRPALLPQTQSGWTSTDDFYIFSDDIYQTLYAVTTNGFSQAGKFHPNFIFDPFEMQIRPNTSQVLAIQDSVAFLNDLQTGELQEIHVGNALDGEVFFTADGVLWANTFIRLPDGDFAECLRIDIETGAIQFMREVLLDPNLTHTRCLSLQDDAFLALMATSELTSLQNLPDDWRYDLHLISSDLQYQQWMTDQYLEQSPLAFSANFGQLILANDETLILYNRNGDSKTLVRLADLGLKSSFLQFEFEWQN